jgi:hypothetical protein
MHEAGHAVAGRALSNGLRRRHHHARLQEVDRWIRHHRGTHGESVTPGKNAMIDLARSDHG